MSDINQILKEVDANYKKHLLIPSEIISEYPVLLRRWTTDELAKMITIATKVWHHPFVHDVKTDRIKFGCMGSDDKDVFQRLLAQLFGVYGEVE